MFLSQYNACIPNIQVQLFLTLQSSQELAAATARRQERARTNFILGLWFWVCGGLCGFVGFVGDCEGLENGGHLGPGLAYIGRQRLSLCFPEQPMYSVNL